MTAYVSGYWSLGVWLLIIWIALGLLVVACWSRRPNPLPPPSPTARPVNPDHQSE